MRLPQNFSKLTLAARATNALGLLKNAALSSERVFVHRRRNPHPTRTHLAVSTDLRRFFCRRRCYSSFPSVAEQEDIFWADALQSGRPYLAPKLPAADREWLQSNAQVSSPETVQSSPRFDWRLRAESRAPDAPGKQKEKGKYVKRIQPPRINVGWNEPYYGAIQNYSKRYVKLFCSSEYLVSYPAVDSRPCWKRSRRKTKPFSRNDSRPGQPPVCKKRAIASLGCPPSGSKRINLGALSHRFFWDLG